MAKILYSMAGEGRGHATRVRAVVEHLKRDHEVLLFAPHDAYDMLAPAYEGSSVRVTKIPGLRFHYTPSQAMDPIQTLLRALDYLVVEMPRTVDKLSRIIDEEEPDLVITDFEPSLPTAAKRCGVPFVSLDHQHFLSVSDFSMLPAPMRIQAALLGTIVELFYDGQAETIVSSFCFPPLRPECAHVCQVGPLLRPSVLETKPRHGEHVVAYTRKFASPRFLEALARCGREVHVYGLGARAPEGRLRFFKIDEQRFVTDLASSDALVSTAGNQLLGEALFFQKPIFAIPEDNNFEQQIHGQLLRESGAGESVLGDEITASHLQRFLGRVDQYRAHMTPARMNGNVAALAAIRWHLSRGGRNKPRTPNVYAPPREVRA